MKDFWILEKTLIKYLDIKSLFLLINKFKGYRLSREIDELHDQMQQKLHEAAQQSEQKLQAEYDFIMDEQLETTSGDDDFVDLNASNISLNR